MHLVKDGGGAAGWRGWGDGKVLVSGDGGVCVRGQPAGVCVRVNGPVCGSMCDPPSSRQPALAHTWVSLHVDTRGSRVRGSVEKNWLQGPNQKVFGHGSAVRLLRPIPLSEP